MDIRAEAARGSRLTISASPDPGHLHRTLHFYPLHFLCIVAAALQLKQCDRGCWSTLGHAGVSHSETMRRVSLLPSRLRPPLYYPSLRRQSSSVPGPLEARRRASKRKFVGVATPRSSHPAYDASVLLSLKPSTSARRERLVRTTPHSPGPTNAIETGMVPPAFYICSSDLLQMQCYRIGSMERSSNLN